MKKIYLVLALYTFSCHAINLGEHGQTYIIAEKDAIRWIYEDRLPELENNGEIKKMQNKLVKDAYKRVESPKGIKLPKTTKKTIRKKSLNVKAPQDYKDARGNVIVKIGQVFKLADYLPPSRKALILIDGDEQSQVNYALKEYSKNIESKIMLANGKPVELTKKHNVTFYFDQSQKTIAHFKVKTLPTKIYRRGSEIIIEEVPVESV